MDDPVRGSIDPSTLREAMVRRLYRRSVASGQITLPAVPAMLDEYVTMCRNVFAGLGVEFTADQLPALKKVLADQLAAAHTASSRSNIVISYHAPFGTTLHYRVEAETSTIETEYDQWVAT